MAGMRVSKIKVTSNFESVCAGICGAKRIIAQEGSMRSGKTWAILQCLVWVAYDLEGWIRFVCGNFGYSEDTVRKNLKFLMTKQAGSGFSVKCFRKKSTTARQSIWKDVRKILMDFGWSDSCKLNETMMTVAMPNGNEFMCCGADEPDKYHSVAQDITYFCELIDFKYEVFNQVNGRTTFCVVVDWNPHSSRHWVYERILKRSPKELLYHHSTYKDNPFLEKSQIAEIENWKPTPENYEKGTADAWLWQVYGLGKRGVRQGVIFDPRKWEVIPDNQFPDKNNCLRHGYGLDLGYSNDPAALVECALSNDKLYLKEIIYETQMLVQKNPDVPWQKSVVGTLDKIGFAKQSIIEAESANPEAIAQMQYSGYNVRATRKFSGSIVEGLERLTLRRICVTESSLGIIFELENYAWKMNARTGEAFDIPEDKHNHAIDAVRYWGLENLNPNQTGQKRGKRRKSNVVQGRPKKIW